jgi:uncharacterized protein YeaO (DUF488 family)/uncharacterized protein with GYD domain
VIAAKRIYDPPGDADGTRVLIMRLWPRGIRKSRVDLWLKELGPVLPLLRAFRGGELDWAQYTRRYLAGLERPIAAPRLSARLTGVTSERARSHATPTGAHGRCEMTKGGSKKMRAYVLIETAPGKTKAVKKELAAIQGSDSTVANLDAVTGPFDFIAVVEGPTLDAVGRLVTDEIGSIDGVTRTTTCLAVAIG